MFYKLCYTCQVEANGEIKKFQHYGYFNSRDLLYFWLSSWSHGKYNYYETSEQYTENITAKEVELPKYVIGWTGKQQHDFVFNC